MFIRKLAVPRRTFLRGMGATIALPLLDAMVPAFTPLAKAAAAPRTRFIQGKRVRLPGLSNSTPTLRDPAVTMTTSTAGAETATIAKTIPLLPAMSRAMS